MKYCPKCGTFINTDVCSNCGWSINPQITPRGGKKTRTKILVIMIVIVAGLTGGGIALSIYGSFSMIE